MIAGILDIDMLEVQFVIGISIADFRKYFAWLHVSPGMTAGLYAYMLKLDGRFNKDRLKQGIYKIDQETYEAGQKSLQTLRQRLQYDEFYPVI